MHDTVRSIYVWIYRYRLTDEHSCTLTVAEAHSHIVDLTAQTRAMANAKKELARADMRQPLIEIVITPPRILEHLLNLGAAEGAQALHGTAVNRGIRCGEC